MPDDNKLMTAQQRIADRMDTDTIRDIQATLPAGSARALFMPQSMGEVMELAKMMSLATGAVPPHLRGKPGECLAVAMQALRWGMDPFAVANKSYFVNDRLAYEAQLVNAVVNTQAPVLERPHIEWQGEGDKMVCRVSAMIKGETKPKEVEQPINTITVKNSPLWKQAPRQQLAYYATRLWARLYAPEVLLGVYTPDELTEDQRADRARDVTPRPTRAAFESGDATHRGAIQEGFATIDGDGVEVIIEDALEAHDRVAKALKVAADEKSVDGIWESNGMLLSQLRERGLGATAESLHVVYHGRLKEIEGKAKASPAAPGNSASAAVTHPDAPRQGKDVAAPAGSASAGERSATVAETGQQHSADDLDPGAVADWTSWGTDMVTEVATAKTVNKLAGLEKEIKRQITGYAAHVGTEKAIELTNLIATRRAEIAPAGQGGPV